MWAHHDSGELETYPRDAADTCLAGFLQIRVTVKNVTHEGLVKLDVYDNEDTFLEKGKQFRKVRVPAEDGEQTICINVDEPGQYVVGGYHDEDGDRKLDKKFGVVPKEPVGMSNNIKMKALRFPKWEEGVIDVPINGIDIDINFVDVD